MNNLLDNKRFRQGILIIADLVIVAACNWLGLLMRFSSGNIPEKFLNASLHGLPFDMIIVVTVFWLFHLYHSVWTYMSTREILRIFEAVTIAVVISITFRTLMAWTLPRSVYCMVYFSMIVLVTMARLSVRIIRNLRKRFRSSGGNIRTMVIGAGSAGSLLLEEFLRSEDEHNVVCIIDDNVNKKGKYLYGVPIVGGRELIEETAKEREIEEIIVAIPSLPGGSISELVQIASRTGARVKILPGIAHSLKGNIAGDVRDITYEDFLMRDAVEIDDAGIDRYISGKKILITGGGGSIGSELCRQIAMRGPRQLLILDIYENNAYSIEQELLRKYGKSLDIRTVIASVRDEARMEQVFREFRPDIVFHAAAHKHVPLMENSPCEAIKNNCHGTWTAAKLADKYGAEKFVLISTDKAVRPTSVMGASKRLCEMIIQDMARKSEKTAYAAVRFGNVLGSNGSVIPLFLKQIESGGPVTVTHREITRFFMTIPEAVSLVMQAGAYAKGGEIFILDMGKPVKIYDLAENLIRMKGLRPGEDIEIKIVGLRPGEKLYEEVLMDEEGMQKTDNELIFIGHPLEFDEEAFEGALSRLIKDAERNAEDIKERVAGLCTTYTITDN